MIKTSRLSSLGLTLIVAFLFGCKESPEPVFNDFFIEYTIYQIDQSNELVRFLDGEFIKFVNLNKPDMPSNVCHFIAADRSEESYVFDNILEKVDLNKFIKLESKNGNGGEVEMISIMIKTPQINHKIEFDSGNEPEEIKDLLDEMSYYSSWIGDCK